MSNQDSLFDITEVGIKSGLKSGDFEIRSKDGSPVNQDIVDDLKFLLAQNDDPFGDTEAEQEQARQRLEARKAGIKIEGEDKRQGIKAFNPVTKTFGDQIDEFDQYGLAGKPKANRPDKGSERALMTRYLKELWPDSVEIRYEEITVTLPSGMRITKDRDGFIDFTVQFNDQAEIAIQATTFGAEAEHLKAMASPTRKAGKGVKKWFESGRKLYMVLTDKAPGRSPKRLNWKQIGRFHRVICIYEITPELLQDNRDRRAKREAARIERNKRRGKTI